MTKKVAITGASGFIGHHVLDKLLQYDIEIIAVTRNASLLNKYAKSVEVVEFDITNLCNSAFDKPSRPDILIHLAWDGLPNYNSLHHFEVELPKQYHFLKNMIEGGLKSLFVTGTCFEYGMQSGCLRADMPTLPSNPYGYAKDALRKQLEFLKTSSPFEFIWGRLFYMYGEGQASNSLYPQLKQAVLRGDNVFNMSGGDQLRDYLRVEDVANQIVKLALSQQDLGCVNICSGIPISVKNLVRKWMLEAGWEIDLNLGYYPYPDYEPMEFWGSLSVKSD